MVTESHDDICDNERLHANNEIVFPPESDSEGEDFDREGYELLPANDLMESSNSEEDNDQSNSSSSALPPETENLSQVHSAELDLVREVWSKPPPEAVDIEMDTTKVNEVKQAMLNITLPASAIPEWANSIPEDEWKQTLLNKLQSLGKMNNSSK